jgi:F-type H+-transporting ATPase subunit a
MSARENGELTMADKNENGSAFDLLGQFDIAPIKAVKDTPFEFITNSAFFMILTVAVIAVLMLVFTASARVVPGRRQTLSEIIYDFGFGLVTDILGKHGRPFLPFVLSVFLFVFVANMWGMMPYSFTVMSHVSLTAFMAVVIFSMVIYIGVRRHGLKWFSLFAPSGVPFWLLPFMIFIEVLSFFVRPLTHSLRLFANMTAGHIVLKVIGTFASFTLIGGIALLPALVALSALEFLVAYLQAYIFALLAAVYLADAVELHH